MTALTLEARTGTVEAFFERLAAADYDAFFALWSPEPAFEMPFAAPGLAHSYPGAAGVRRFFRTFRGALSEAAWRIDRIVAADVNASLVAEGRGACVTTAGRAYNNRYVWLMTFDADARLTLVREYSDPAIITKSFGGADVLGPAFANQEEAA